LRREVRRTDVSFAVEDAEFREACEKRGLVARFERGRLVVEVKEGGSVAQLLQAALERRLDVIEVAPRYDTLEDLFVRSGAGTEVAS
jgi:hypothetical protein